MDKKLLGDRIADELMRYILEEPVEVGQKLRYQFHEGGLSGRLRNPAEHALQAEANK